MAGTTRPVALNLTDPRAPSFLERTGDGWVVFVDTTPTAAEAFAHSVARGLSDHPRWLHCRYLYDEAGSALFGRITAQPEYYLTRAETEILTHQSDAIREAAGPVPLVELGAGMATKTRNLLSAWARAGGPVEYIPVDIDASVLTAAAERLAMEFPGISITGLATSYERGLHLIEGQSPLCLVFLGSTIGNFNPRETDAFLTRLEGALSPEDQLLLGVDLVKPIEELEAAYNDAAGVSQEFTRNLFRRMNRELGTAIPVESIDHVAYWNDRLERIEIYARFRHATTVELPSIQRRFRVAAGEMILTEISRKYRLEGVESDFARFGFKLESSFTDTGGRFGLLLFRLIDPGARPDRATRLAAELQRVRRRTLDLIDALDEPRLQRQVLPILSPIAWDLGHIAEFEELWLVRTVDALLTGGDTSALAPRYDAIQTPRSERGRLELPSRAENLDRLDHVRKETLRRLRAIDLEGHPLLEDGFVYRLLAQHEAQHQETFLQAIARMDDLAYEPAYREATPRPALPPDTDMVLIDAGPFPLGAPRIPEAYDNERPVAWVDVDGFWIDTAPVTNGAFLAFMEAGGYDTRDWWTAEGWEWRREEDVRHPLGWRCDEGGWVDAQFGHVEPLVPSRPVQHVSWYEADACARSLGKRLPTEIEWEKAAAWDPEVRIARRYPWGDSPPDPTVANLDARTFAPAPIGAYPRGRSFYGCHQMIGDVWEWTASEFLPYPGFEAFPYPEYSEAHFGKGHRVLRGGSWATAPMVARNSFRNWDLPQRRQIFAGFRCAKSA
ncbi:MAG TPA: ergothioneine biosynthesis protein EgtB [Gemmatimonadota bacterium]|jgi:iron(II)-dependent oxidoreductase|nr:ergothioneine biosynthesis protein EgtB [Gemmatimonadota bacterium]